MKKILTLLAVAMLPATLSGCAACCPGTSLCPCCPCNWFNREPACPPAPAVCCPPTTYATPVAATACPPMCPSPCAPACPTCPPVASQMMPQYVMPQAMPMAAAGPQMCSPCGAMAQQQPMMFQPAYYGEASCGCSSMMMMEPGCGFPTSVSYGPFDMGACSACGSCGSGGCCDAGSVAAPPAAEGFVEPRPGE